MEMRRDDFDLAAELSALRPSPSPAFTDDLDARLVAGFKRPDRSKASLVVRIGEKLRATSPRRIVLPASGVALAAIVAATAVVAIDQPAQKISSAGRFGDFGQGAVPDRSAARRASGNHSGVQYSAAPPTATRKLSEESSGGAAGAPASAGIELQSESAPAPRSTSEPFAANASHRDIERSAEMVLGADPAAVHTDAAKVFDAVHAVDGIVLRSSIRDGGEGEAGAQFDLLIPAIKVGDALASFSRIDEVRSRHESTLDITAPTVRAGERLDDSVARIDSLLAQLSDAESEGERAAVETELQRERRTAAALRSRLDRLRHRADFTRVSLQIESDSAASATGGQWGVGNALNDAGRILTIAAGVVIVGLAVLGPLALIALLAWLTRRALLRRSRERALA